MSPCGAVCETGWVDCDGNVANGCEAMGACTVERELFYDGFESGGRWSVDSVWNISRGGFYAPCAGEREMIGERSVFDPCSISGDATLITPIDISRAESLTLTHQSRSYLGSGSSFSVSVSTDGGRTWTPVASQGNASCGLRSIDLGAFVGRSSLLVRFTFQTSGCETAYWRLDEVRVHARVRNY